MSIATAGATGDPASVLVVDDERGPREALQIILGPHFQVFAVESGEEALEIVQSRRIDVATLDLKMPGLSGPETLRRLREIDPSLEVVIVTGYGSFENALEVLRLRAFDYVSKPFQPGRILEAVRQAAASRRARTSETERLTAALSGILREIEAWWKEARPRLEERDRIALEGILVRLSGLHPRRGVPFGTGHAEASARDGAGG